MPSSELLRTVFFGLPLVSQLKSLLLGMRKSSWAKAVYKFWNSHGQLGGFCTLSTMFDLGPRFAGFVVRSLGTVFARCNFVFTQFKFVVSYLIGGWFYSFSTMPNEATKRFKGLVI